MVNYNDALTNVYTNGLYESPSLNLSVESFGKLYFNAEVTSPDTLTVFFRTGATESAVEDGLSLTVDHTTEKFSAVGHGYSNGDRIAFKATALPTGILDTVLYYVVGVAGVDFQVSLTSGGSAVTFTSNGTAVTSKKWENSIVDSGAPIVATVNTWVQYLVEFVVADSTVDNATLFYADGVLVKFSYRKSGTIAETSVEFIYETGEMNHEEPMVDKIYKRLALEHLAEYGSCLVTWETENATASWTIDLSRYPKRWQSFFHDTAMGETLSLRFYKNDLEDYTLKEFKGFFTPQPMLI
jgi:hypothetical protein